MAGYRVRAEEADPGSRTRGQVIFSILFLLLVVFCDVLLGRMLYDSMTDVDAIQVKQLKVEGGLRYLSEKKVADYFLSNYDNLNLLTMDLSKVRRYLLKMPWARTVTVKKRLPDILYVYLTEYRPAAYFNNGILTGDWKVIYPDLSDFREPLAHLYGRENQAEKIFNRYLAFRDFLKERSNAVVESVELTPDFMWEIRLQSGLILYLGRDLDTFASGREEREDSDSSDALLTRLRTFAELNNRIPELMDKAEYVDLRYETGAAVKWRQEVSEAEEKK
ncbi:cell division protein FtsQ/DivIB [Succinimonas sp.]|uniref:cell division protein FtsQ/DivIB n=1 Tax=Succinimonas sp. TaxID=1936151 RepID=UPI0038640892